MNNKTAIIFAGGKSSRMGRDKSLLSFGGYSSLARYQYEKLSQIFNQVYISAKSDKFDFDVKVIKDNYKISSPLVGLISVFEQLDINEVFILSVDAPFVDKNIIEKLYKLASPKSDIIIAKSPNGIEPLCGIYKKSILNKAKLFLKKNNHKLKTLLNELNTQEVYFENKDNFINLNYPYEYEYYFQNLIPSLDN